jgi:hypothetical protein
MFFIRSAFWLGVVVLVLPTDAQQQARLAAKASAAVTHVSTFCDRNPATCVKGAEYWAVFVKKAEFGGRLAWDLVNERKSMTLESQPHIAPTAQPQPEPPRGSLTPADLQPAWRGKPPRTGA